MKLKTFAAFAHKYFNWPALILALSLAPQSTHSVTFSRWVRAAAPTLLIGWSYQKSQNTQIGCRLAKANIYGKSPHTFFNKALINKTNRLGS